METSTSLIPGTAAIDDRKGIAQDAQETPATKKVIDRASSGGVAGSWACAVEIAHAANAIATLNMVGPPFSL